MTKTFFASPAKVAIYEGARNAGVENSPMSHLDKIYFHSDLPYIGIRSVVEGSVTIDASGYSGAPASKTVNLFAHGLGYRPFIIGAIWSNKPKYGSPAVLPFSGTVPWWGNRSHPTSGGGADVAHLHLTCDASHVSVWCREAVLGGAVPASFTFNYRIFVTRKALPI